ncbi:MAG: isochorismatase family protein [Bacteroides sp.]|nr:isochorismatase family protein [Bacteroides sp.]
MKRLLLIVDPQNDFINGSLAVAEAEAKMQALASYIATNAERYQAIFVTMDSHPAKHCSFVEQGGIWPPHCVLHTPGWETPAYLDETFKQSKSVVLRYYKGTKTEKEEYSIFDNEEDGVVLARHISEAIAGGASIDICGIAGDYCVLETLKGLRTFVADEHIRVLTDYIASIDGGDALNSYLGSSQIEM